MLSFLGFVIVVLLLIMVVLFLTLAWQGGLTNPEIYKEY